MWMGNFHAMAESFKHAFFMGWVLGAITSSTSAYTRCSGTDCTACKCRLSQHAGSNTSQYEIDMTQNESSGERI
jgi:hypothetical protein